MAAFGLEEIAAIALLLDENRKLICVNADGFMKRGEKTGKV
jgi:hypothetical protein